MRTLVALITTIVIALIALIVGAHDYLIGIAIMVGGEGIFLYQGFRKIKEKEPPQKAIVTFLGRRLHGIKDNEGNETTISVNEGWRFFPFYPLIFGFVEVSVQREPFDILVKTKTPDNSDVEIPISLTVRPMAKYMIQYENSGGLNGVKKNLEGELSERVREWAEGLQEGPMNWQEAYQAKLEMASILLKKIVGNGLTDIPSKAQEIPTYILLMYISVPRVNDENKVSINARPWVKNNWEKVENILNQLNPDEQKDILDKTRARKEEVQDTRSGKGKLDIIDLGVRVERLNIGEVKVTGKAGEAADKKAKEQLEMEAEELEVTHLLKQLKRLRKKGKYSPEQALEILQTERSKVVKTVDEKKLNISPETRGLLKDISPDILKAVFNRKEVNNER